MYYDNLPFTMLNMNKYCGYLDVLKCKYILIIISFYTYPMAVIFLLISYKYKYIY